MALYLILPGESFKDSDGTIKSGGDVIELDPAMAAHHRDKLDPVPAADEQQNPEPV